MATIWRHKSLFNPLSPSVYDATWNEAPLVGVFKAVQTIKFAGETSKVEKIVIVCPLWLLFVIVAAVIFILIWIFARNKKRKNR